MKTLTLISLLLTTQAFAQIQPNEELYRPYLSCVATSGAIMIEVVQGIDKAAKPFQVTIEKKTDGKIVQLLDLTTSRIPIKHKNILDLFEGFSEKTNYRFELTVMRSSAETGHRAMLADTDGVREVFCNYHITGL